MGANLKEVRGRISSVKSTQQITKAMKMVSASKLRRAQEAITNLRPYAEKLSDMMDNILSNTETSEDLAFNLTRPVSKILIVPISSSRGLAGAFNTNINKQLNVLVNADYGRLQDGKSITIAPVGKKVFEYTVKNMKGKARLVDDYVQLMEDLSFDHIVQLPNLIMQRFLEERYDKVYVIFSKFKNAATQDAIIEQFLPVDSNDMEQDEEKSSSNADYIFEPNQNALLQELIPSILQVKFQRYLLDSNASEHGARMTAMDKATENAEELVKELKIQYNKARQEAITSEISEIVGGAAALEGN